MPESRRRFIGALAGAALGATRAAGAAPANGRYAIAYTSFAVRAQQARAAGASALPAETFIDLVKSFGADGCQLDLSQLVSTEPAALDALKKKLDSAGLFLEISIPGKQLEDPQRFAEAARIARRLGALRGRVALLSGRRYETFATKESWREFADHWRAALPRLKAALERERLPIGIENHKDWRADELVELIRSVGSRYLGACVDFGNNLALLEDPLEVVRKLAPYAVTTHLKDMAVRPHPRGFELSEVPLGTGFLPLKAMIDALRARKPEVPLCLEMLTRDPLEVPFLDDRYWVTYDRRDEARIEAFRKDVLSHSSTEALPRISGETPEVKLAVEDDNVRRSTAFARKTLQL